ncbi:MAG: hypothetical protein F9K31_09010 [Dokdonella sp.]|nr:MAG: hypothetical protein F9K31_09010 [Dokdonella sp.]
MRRSIAWLAMALLPVAVAQDGVMIGGDSMMWSVPDHGSSALAQSVMRSTLGGRRTSAPTGSTMRGGVNRSRTDTRVRYDSTISREVEREFLAGLGRRSGAAAAERFGAHFRGRPMHGQFAIAADPYGLRKEDLVDVTTAYFTVMWMVANNAPVPAKPQVAGLQRQVRALLEGPRGVPDDMAERQRLAESLMYKLVTMILLREDAQRTGNTPALRELAAYAQHETGKGFDLKASRLTAQGFVPR